LFKAKLCVVNIKCVQKPQKLLFLWHFFALQDYLFNCKIHYVKKYFILINGLIIKLSNNSWLIVVSGTLIIFGAALFVILLRSTNDVMGF
jgi:hypothetical protein